MIEALFPLPAVLLDLETTGASPSRDRITEIGLIELDGSAPQAGSDGHVNGTRWSSLVQPGMPIPEFITGLTGIDDGMVDDAPRFADLAHALARRLEGRLLIAHNVRFDYGFLRAEFERAGIAFAVPVLCSAKLSRRLYPQHHRHNLDALIARHGIFCIDRHRALGDALVIGEFLQAAVADLGAARVAEVAQALIVPASAPRAALDLVEDLPGRAGCFMLKAADGSTLYVGSSGNARDEAVRLLQRSTALGRALIADTASIEFERHAGVLGAALAQRRLVDRLKPRHQRARDMAAEAARASWQIAWHPGATPEFVLREAVAAGGDGPAGGHDADADADAPAAAFGDFPGERIARNALLAFAREHRLCPPLLGLGAAAEPCSAWSAGHCHGACSHPAAGSETLASHRGRALTALARLPRPAPPPHAGLAGYREVDAEGTSVVHLFRDARYLGAADDPDALAALIERASRAATADDPVDLQPMQILARVLKIAGSRIERIRL